MADHACGLVGNLVLRPHTGTQKVKDLFLAYVQEANKAGTSWEELVATGGCELIHEASATAGWADRLEISMDVRGPGEGQLTKELRALLDGLSVLVQPGWVELLDYMAEDPYMVRIPFFLGATETEKAQAQLRYGLKQAQPWLEPILGDRGMAEISMKVLVRGTDTGRT